MLISILGVSCNLKKQDNILAKSTSRDSKAQIKFDTTYHDFGTLIEGEQAAFTFRFQNTGTGDLVILDAYSTCGCTVPNYSKEPILPGQKGQIDVVFNSKSRQGVQYKNVTLKLNTPISEKTLTIKANVIKKSV